MMSLTTKMKLKKDIN